MQRHIPLTGQPNFRDLGGYESRNGRRVRWGSIFRSGELSQLTDDDIDTLEALGIRTIVDLRSPDEVSARGRSRAPSGARVVPMPIANGDVFTRLIPMMLQGDFSQVPSDLLDHVNRLLVRDFSAEFAGLLRTVLDPANRPLVFHCTQGKDRAGFGAATVLSALDVPWTTVVEDYLLSNHFRRDDNEKLLGMIRQMISGDNDDDGLDLSKIEGLLYVKEASIDAAREEIMSIHGGLEEFLTGGLGVTARELEEFRQELLE